MYDAEIISLEKWNGTMTLVYEFYLKRVVWEIVSSGEMMNQWWWRNSFTNFVSGRIEIRNLKKRKKKEKNLDDTWMYIDRNKEHIQYVEFIISMIFKFCWDLKNGVVILVIEGNDWIENIKNDRWSVIYFFNAK